MNKFWMMGGAVIAVSVAAVVWNSGPVRSSENLLGKAQSEFAMKARDALIQRQMAQASPAPAVVAAPKSASLLPYVVASLEPVAAPTVVARETRFEAVAPEPPTVTAASPDASIVTRDSVLPPAPPAVPVADETQAKNLQVASLQEEPAVSVSPKWILAGASELARVDGAVTTPTYAAPRQQIRAERKTRHVRRERRANAGVYRPERSASRTLTPYNLNSLRARSPELAAAIARYM